MPTGGDLVRCRSDNERVALTARLSHLRATEAPDDDVLSSEQLAPLRPDVVDVQTIRQRQHRLEPDEVLELVSEYRAGSSVKTLVAKWEINRTTVLDHLARHDVPRRPAVRKMTDLQVRLAAEEAGRGASINTMADQFGVSDRTLRRELSRSSNGAR